MRPNALFIEIRKVMKNTVRVVRNTGNGCRANKTNGLYADDDADAMRTADDNAKTPSAQPSSPKYMKNNRKDDADTADDDLRLFSNQGLEGSV